MNNAWGNISLLTSRASWPLQTVATMATKFYNMINTKKYCPMEDGRHQHQRYTCSKFLRSVKELFFEQTKPHDCKMKIAKSSACIVYFTEIRWLLTRVDQSIHLKELLLLEQNKSVTGRELIICFLHLSVSLPLLHQFREAPQCPRSH